MIWSSYKLCFLKLTKNITFVIASKSLVITASGRTLFKAMALKKKFINIEVASNQKFVDKFLKNKGIKITIKAKI